MRIMLNNTTITAIKESHFALSSINLHCHSSVPAKKRICLSHDGRGPRLPLSAWPPAPASAGTMARRQKDGKSNASNAATSDDAMRYDAIRVATT